MAEAQQKIEKLASEHLLPQDTKDIKSGKYKGCFLIPFCIHAQLYPFFTTIWTAAHQAPLFMGFPRQEHWSRLPCPPPGDLPHPGIKPEAPALAGEFFYH